MTKTIFGTAIGVALGFAVAFGNFGDLALVGLFALVGYGVTKVVTGSIDVGATMQPLRDRFQRSNAGRGNVGRSNVVRSNQ
ncbi:hypothetical protein DFJ67_6463 [Asanoa ferruginea]|jgi:hypothetical protein|uniref:Small integral membrane protein DUF2273 n=1 Tax=Asanoa ferruginea TaxID=53367 RepID=A0A3D9ZU12_9ACTN|nr:hypothetical protein [Asanoa ferruginea]REG00410.1 hypothetical protein DFJ67_6463 [Asanoa ferruginea]